MLRDLFVLAAVYGSLPLILLRPFVGLLVFSWLAYMRPHEIAWTIGSERLSLLVAGTLLVGLLVHAADERFATFRPQTLLLIAFGGWFAITGVTAVVPGLADRWVEQMLKVILICVLTTGLVRSHRRLRLLMLVIAFSLGLLGFKYGLFGVVRGGARILRGPGGFMADNNALALTLVMVIPLLLAVAWVDRSRYVRMAAATLVPFTVLAVVFTFSRGGFLALGAVGAIVILRSGRPLLAALLVLLSLGGFSYLTSEDFQQEYLERAETITSYEQDASAMGRVAAWRTALRMSRDYPVFGVGPDNFMPLYERYGSPGEKARVTHNSLLQLLAENGLPAVALFVAMLWLTLWRLERQRRAPNQPWVRSYASGIQISILGFAVGAMLLDMAYHDLVYHLVALSVGLETAAASEQAADDSRDPQDGERADEIPWWAQTPVRAAGP